MNCIFSMKKADMAHLKTSNVRKYIYRALLTLCSISRC